MDHGLVRGNLFQPPENIDGLDVLFSTTQNHTKGFVSILETGIQAHGLLERFKGGVGHGIQVNGPRKLCEPVALDRLRQQVSGFRPPQMYQYIVPGQRPLLDALEQGLRSGQRPCGPAGCASDNGTARSQPWLANRQGGREQHFV